MEEVRPLQRQPFGQNLRIGTGFDLDPVFQFGGEGLIVVDLAVERQDAAALRVKRLRAAFPVNHREAAMAEADARRDKAPFAVGAAMGEGVGHALQRVAIDFALGFKVQNTGDAAHKTFKRPLGARASSAKAPHPRRMREWPQGLRTGRPGRTRRE